jgi:hypothetical protein
MEVAARMGGHDRIAGWGLRAALLLGGAAALSQLAAFRFDADPSLLDSSADGGLFGALGVVVFAGAVGAALLVALSRPALRRTALPCAVLLGAVFALEVANVPHSRAIAAPLGAGAIVLLLRLGRADETAARLLRAGCAVLVVAYLGHALGAWLVSKLDQGPDSWAYQVKAVVKHAGELAGWTLVLAGLAALLVRRGARLR